MARICQQKKKDNWNADFIKRNSRRKSALLPPEDPADPAIDPENAAPTASTFLTLWVSIARSISMPLPHQKKLTM